MDDNNEPSPMDGAVPGDQAAGQNDPAVENAASQPLGEAGGPAHEAASTVGTPEPAEFGSAPDFEQLHEPGAPGQTAPLAMLYDLDLPVAIELGRTRLAVQDVLALSRGSVVQLDRQAGEPVDVYVGDKRFAEAEVVIVGEQFGVRITRLVSNAGLPAAG